MKFIVCNIHDFIGQCAGAVHFYVDVNINVDYKISDNNLSLLSNYWVIGSTYESLNKVITQEEADILNKIDGEETYHEGMKCSRFNTIEEIHKTLLEKYPNENIVTFYEKKPFKKMMIKVNGEMKDYTCLGEVWDTLPMSVYSELIPENYKIRCYCCDHILTKEEMQPYITEKFNNRRPLTLIHIPCCPKCGENDLEWNVIL